MEELKACPMPAEQKKAYEWAKNQNYSSVAAQYAKVLADYITDCTAPENKPLTNGDRIRSMSNEELAEFLNNVEGAGYFDDTIALDQNGKRMDMLAWLKLKKEDES